MADLNMMRFYDRLEHIQKRNKKLERGAIHVVSEDGLIVARPWRASPGFPWRTLMLVLVALLGFKGMLYMELGSQAYNARVELLSAGNTVERLGGFAMKADPITIWVAGYLETILR